MLYLKIHFLFKICKKRPYVEFIFYFKKRSFLKFSFVLLNVTFYDDPASYSRGGKGR